MSSGHEHPGRVFGIPAARRRQINGSLGPALRRLVEPRGGRRRTGIAAAHVPGAHRPGHLSATTAAERSFGQRSAENVVNGLPFALVFGRYRRSRSGHRGRRVLVPVCGQCREPFDALLDRPERFGPFHLSAFVGGGTTRVRVLVVFVVVRALRAGALLVVLEERVDFEVLVDKQAPGPSGRFRHDPRGYDGRIRVRVRTLVVSSPRSAATRRRRRLPAARLGGGGSVVEHFVEVLEYLFDRRIRRRRRHRVVRRDHLVRRYLGLLGRHVLLAVVLLRRTDALVFGRIATALVFVVRTVRMVFDARRNHTFLVLEKLRKRNKRIIYTTVVDP